MMDMKNLLVYSKNAHSAADLEIIVKDKQD
jgi:hypothetical protein